METPITLNVGGRIFQTYLSTIMKYPETMLARCLSSKLAKLNEKGEYFFDRHSTAFEAILNIYRSSKVICPPTLDREMFNDELKYWGFDEQELPVPMETYLIKICNFPKIFGKILHALFGTSQPNLHQILGSVLNHIEAKQTKLQNRDPFLNYDTDSDSEAEANPNAYPSMMKLIRLIIAQSKEQTTEPDPDLHLIVQVYQLILTAIETERDSIILPQIKPTPNWGKFLDAGYFHFSRVEKVHLKIENVYDHEMKGFGQPVLHDWCRRDYFYVVQGKRYYLDDDDIPHDKQVVVYICHL